ncbi:hypothetical protein SCUCBS95973_006061 [Sporothrix curviconia]|uniref:Uncharacterized protein n=1 Tax=Sporothrix curviconia TaxID=1260050 RepID=A0ABP0C204_9PEZI
MQLQWLPRHLERLAEDTATGAPFCFCPGDAVVAVPHPVTSRLLQSGQTFQVTLPSLDDAAKMKAMLDFQWACLQVARYFAFDVDDYGDSSGAARALRYGDEGLYDEYEFTAG